MSSCLCILSIWNHIPNSLHYENLPCGMIYSLNFPVLILTNVSTGTFFEDTLFFCFTNEGRKCTYTVSPWMNSSGRSRNILSFIHFSKLRIVPGIKQNLIKLIDTTNIVYYIFLWRASWFHVFWCCQITTQLRRWMERK